MLQVNDVCITINFEEWTPLALNQVINIIDINFEDHGGTHKYVFLDKSFYKSSYRYNLNEKNVIKIKQTNLLNLIVGTNK